MGREQRRNLEDVWGKHRVGELGASSTDNERVGGDSNTQKLMQPLAGCRTGPTAKGCREAKTRSEWREPESEQGGRTSTLSQHVKNRQRGQT